jgi:hypothetical protein
LIATGPKSDGKSIYVTFPGIRANVTSLKLTEQIITDLLCCFNFYPKESVHQLKVDAGFWHLTLCTLLSSQGSGAPTPIPFGTGLGQLS